MSIARWLPPIQSKLEEMCAAGKRRVPATLIIDGVEKHTTNVVADPVPIGIAIGWIDVESGGRLDEITSRDERGLFQLDPEESTDLGISLLDHRRLSTDLDWSLLCGMKLIQAHREAVARYKIDDFDLRTEYTWRLTKFSHSIGMGGAARIVREANETSQAGDWARFSEYCRINSGKYLAPKKDGGIGHDPVKWLELVNRTCMAGERWGLDQLALRCGT